MSSWIRSGARRGKRAAQAQHHTKRRRLAAGIEALEERQLMSGDGLQGLYDAGAAYVDPLWFQSLSQSSAARNGNGLSTFEQTTGSITWKGAAVDVYMDEWIVQLTREAAAQVNVFSDVTSLFNNSDLGIEVIGGLGLQGQILVRARGASADTIGQWFTKQDAIAYYEPNAILPLERTANDPSMGQTWGLNNTGQTINGQAGVVDADIDAPEAWDLTTGSRSIVVGIIDTGVDYNHVDLAANIWTNPGEIAGNGIDDDHNGFVDDIHGYDFVNNDGDPMDDNGHGTHVAGTIGALGNNSVGVAGINWSTSIMALKFLSGSGSGSLYDAVRAVNYATMMRTQYGVNIRLTNNSWGGGGYQQSLYDAINANGQAGILFVAAAGNDSNNNDAAASYPSSYNLSNVIAVAATDNRDQLASFSNYGATTVDLAAPGVSILSAKNGGGYQYMSGTSMATPHVSGVAALAWALDPNATVQQVRDAILNGVDHISSLSGKVATGGRLNARGALEQLGMRVVSSTPAVDATVTNPPLNFTIDFSANIAAATVQAADFRVNGIAANNYTIVDANTITFRFNSSPVTAQGPQTMQIAAGAIGRAGSGVGFSGWQATFNYDQTAMAVVSTTPDENATLTSTPTALTFTLNEAVNAASVSASDLVLSSGTVTGAALVNATTVRYTISLPTFEGPLTYTLARGALTDAYGNPSAAYTGHVTVDDPSIVRYQASGLPLAIPDQGTITSTLTINDNYLISDLDVELTLGHTWNDDLDVYLIAPDGTRIELFTDVGGSGQGFTGTILDDQATQGIASGSAPFTGRFRPEGLLSAVNGKRTGGTWRLEISDDYEWDTGAITAWSLQFRVVRGPSLAAVPDQTVAHNTGAWTRQLDVTNPSGNPLGYSATATGLAVDPAYTLDQQLGLWADPARVAANFYFNALGGNVKWICGSNGTYYGLYPNGEVRLYGGSFETTTQVVAVLDTRYYDNPHLLINAQPTEVAVAAAVDASGRLTVTPPSGFVGDIRVHVAVSDGAQSDAKSFTLHVTNQPAQLASLADQTVSHNAGPWTAQLAVSNPDGDPLTYAVTATGWASHPAYELDQQLGLWADPTRMAANFYFNALGGNVKWVRGANDTFYGLYPNGEVRLYGGSFENTTQMLAVLDTRYYDNPHLLINAQPTEVAVAAAVDASGRLTVTPPSGFVGDIRVNVAVSDGAQSDTKGFTLHVTNQPAQLAALADQTVAHNAVPWTAQLAVSNPDGDPLTYAVTATGWASHPAYELAQQLGLWADPARVAANYYFNALGGNVKWVRGSNDTFYGLYPNGEVRLYGGSFENTTQVVAVLDTRYYDNPHLLINAQPTEVAVAAAVDASGRLTVTPPSGFVGDIRVNVAVSDGAQSDTKGFTLHVTNQPAQLAALADQTVAHNAVPWTAQLAVSNPDGDPLTYAVTATGWASHPAYELAQQLGLWADPARVAANYYFNALGGNVKWVRGSNDTFYGLYPNGEVRLYGGSFENTTRVVAVLDTRYYDTPPLLINAQPTAVAAAAAVDASGRLTVTPPSGFVGDIRVHVAVSDGAQSDTKSFVIHVTELQSDAWAAWAASDVQAAATEAPGGATSPASQTTFVTETNDMPASWAAFVAAADYIRGQLPVLSSSPELLASMPRHTAVVMPALVAEPRAELADSWSRETASSAVAAISPTSFLHREGRVDPQLVQPLAAARAKHADRFSTLADRVFADVDELEATLQRFDAELGTPLAPRAARPQSDD